MADADFQFVDPVDISSQIPANFTTQMDSKKWTDRKEALDIIEKATSAPRILASDTHGELVKILKRTIAKDSNIVVVTLAAKCLCQLAQGLRTDFRPYADSCLTIIFDKFKEKKPNVVAILRDASDACFVGTNLEDIHTDVITFLDNKNPQIKAEICLFLARNFAKFPLQVRNKKILKPLVNALTKTLSDMDATVRDNSAMAIGTAMKVIGENLMMPLIADVEPIKITKIKEFCDKAEIIQPQVNGQENGLVAQTNGESAVPEVQTNGVEDDEDEEERVYDMLDAVDISSQIPANFTTQMDSKKWTDRKEALDIIEKATSAPKIQLSDTHGELVRILKRTIIKDPNIVVVTLAAKCLCQLAQGLRTDFRQFSDPCLAVIFEKFKEKKPNVVAILRDASDACFVGTNLEDIHADVITFLDNKNPQIKAEMCLFLARNFAKFPLQVRNKKILKPLVNALTKTLSDMDATVRDNSAMAIGTAMKVIGENLMMQLIADVEPIKIAKIKEFCDKAQVKKMKQLAAPPAAAAPIAAAPVVKSSATLTRPASSATVKRTATIIKRPTTNRRASGPFKPPQPQAPAPVAVPAPAPPAPVHAEQPRATPKRPNVGPVIKQDNLDMRIFKIVSDSHDEVIASLDELAGIFTPERDPINKTRINQIIDLSCLQLVKSFYSKCDGATVTITKSLDLLTQVFARKDFASAASQASIRHLLAQAFVLTQSHSDLDEVTRTKLNNLVAKIMDSSDPTSMVKILTGLLGEPSQVSIVEPIKDAIIRSMRSIK